MYSRIVQHRLVGNEPKVTCDCTFWLNDLYCLENLVLLLSLVIFYYITNFAVPALSYTEPPGYLLECIVIVLAGLSRRRIILARLPQRRGAGLWSFQHHIWESTMVMAYQFQRQGFYCIILWNGVQLPMWFITTTWFSVVKYGNDTRSSLCHVVECILTYNVWIISS